MHNLISRPSHWMTSWTRRGELFWSFPNHKRMQISVISTKWTTVDEKWPRELFLCVNSLKKGVEKGSPPKWMHAFVCEEDLFDMYLLLKYTHTRTADSEQKPQTWIVMNLSTGKEDMMALDQKPLAYSRSSPLGNRGKGFLFGFFGFFCEI